LQTQNEAAPGSAFSEGYVEADGFRIRYMEAGSGIPLIHLHGAGGLRLTPAHDLLSRQFRVIAFEMPGFGQSLENTRTHTMPELASTMAQAARNLGLDDFNLMGTSFGGKTALWMALQQPERVRALVLEAPAAMRPKGLQPPSASDSPEVIARRLYAHPERQPLPRIDPAIQEKHRKLVTRLGGPARDDDLESRMTQIAAPTLVVFGTRDAIIPAEMGRYYKELIPNSHLVFVYDAGHMISADRPEAFTEVAVDFLERHEAFIISRTETVIHP
jgi:pimeloyl-ACP methyl ester carboxylesterase